MKYNEVKKSGFYCVLTVAAFCIWAAGCSNVPVLEIEDGGAPGSSDADGDADGDSDTDTDSDSDSDADTGLGGDSRDEYCEGKGPTIAIGTNDGDGEVDDICTGNLAEQTFRFALCTCTDGTSMGQLKTGSFDSAQGPFDEPDDSGGAVGINRNLAMPGNIDIGGTTILAGPKGVVLPGVTKINGDFKVKGPLQFAGTLDVTRDLHVGGNLTNFGVAEIGRDLYLEGLMVVPGLTSPNGKTIKGPVNVDPPCKCAPDQILDIPSVVKDARTNNHNNDVALHKDSLKVIIGNVDLELPCGRFYLSSVGGAGKLTLRIHGRTALFIDGNFNLTGDLELDMGDEGELDVFISGNMAITGANDFGQESRPAAVRFYVAGSKDVTITGATGFVGNLYAPRATVILTGATYVYGAIFAGNFLAMGDSGIYYDRDILNAGEDCEEDEPTTPGDECLPAGGSCEEDSDCCEPLVCEGSTCQSLVIV